MIRLPAIAAVLIALPAIALAQQSGEPSLKQLELDGNSGYAVILDGEGHEHHCEARVTREAVDLGPCRPLRLVTPLVPEREEPQARIPSMSPAKRAVVDLFERNRCAIDYADLKRTLESLGARQRETIARTVAEMTDRGEIADDAGRERAVLKIGDRCG